MVSKKELQQAEEQAKKLAKEMGTPEKWRDYLYQHISGTEKQKQIIKKEKEQKK